MSIRELLPLYALGLVDDDEARDVESALAAEPRLVEELATLMDAASELTGVLPGVVPAPALRERVLASTFGRFDRFVDRFAAIFDVAADHARALLGFVDDPASWEPGPIAGTWLLHFPPSPSLAGADTGFVRLAPGVTFPHHWHTGREYSLVLSGRAQDTIFGELRPGAEAEAEAGTNHELVNDGSEDFIYAVYVFGVDFDPERSR